MTDTTTLDAAIIEAESFIVNHERRIADLEKQVAELRAALNKEPTP